MAERKTLSITQVNEIQKVGTKQIPKLSFRAKDGDKELTYFTFKGSLFDSIKAGQTINADVEISSREWEGQEYIDRRIIQIYVDGQPIGGKGGGQYRGKSPEELEQQARVMVLSYAKDLAVAQLIPLDKITNQAEIFYNWLKGNGKESPQAPKPKLETEIVTPSEAKTSAPIDMAWLKESLDELKWKNLNVVGWLTTHYPEAKGAKPKEVVESLTREHQEEFIKEVQSRLDMSRGGV